MTPVLKLGFPPLTLPRLWGWGPVSQGTVRPDRVVVLPPPFDEHLGLEQRVKRFPFQQFVSEAAVVAADVIRHTPVDARSRPADQLRRTRAGARRPGHDSSVARRVACDRHPQLVTGVGRKAPKPQDRRTGRRFAPR